MAKKNILKLEYDWDFFLVGIVSAARDYQLCWNLNRLLAIQLKKEIDLELNLKKKNKLAVFCHFKFIDEIDKCEYHLLGNKFTGELLIPEYKMVDYWLKIKGFNAGERKNNIMRSLKELQIVTAIIDADASQLKSGENLILD